MLAIAFSCMKDKGKRAHMGRMDSHQEDGSGQLMRIILQTNRYGIQWEWKTSQQSSDSLHPQFIQFIKIKEIKAVEEIFFSYYDKSFQ